jgi:Domain of unknown function (DUF3598)
MARHDLAQYSSFTELLSGIAGVWEGTYTHLKPSGELMERFGSRQETRLRGTQWFERIVYSRPGQEPEILDFRAGIDGQRMIFDDPNFHGESFLVEGRMTVFPYHWKNQDPTGPQAEIVEVIVLAQDNYRTRLWQTFHDGELVRLTVIEERRLTDQTPAEWT